jgi:hypothetical protein
VEWSFLVTEWLHKLLFWLLGLEAPAGTVLQSAELHLRGLFSWYVAGLLLAIFAAGAIYFYVREVAPMGKLRRTALIVLRVAVLALLLALLMRPVLVLEYKGERPQGVAVLLDNTESMKLQDRRVLPADKLRVAIANGLTAPNISITDATAELAKIAPLHPEKPERADIVRAVLTNPQIKLIDGLQKHGPLRMFTFGQQVRRVGEEGGELPAARLVNAFSANESRTALSDAINDVLLSKDGDLPGALFLITDGQDNASKIPLDEVAQECARLKVPLYIYGVGTSEGGSLQFKDVLVPDTIFYEDHVTVPVRWRSRGLKQGLAVISLSMGGKVVAQREVMVREGEDFREVLSFTPQKKGTEREEKTDIVATIQIKGNSDYKDEIKRPVQMIDRRVKVLYVESTPRWEFKFLQPTLMRDRRVEASFVLINGDPRLMTAGPPFLPAFPNRDKLFTYDLLILGDVPSSYLDSDKLIAIQDFVKEGGGLVVIAGRYHAPASFVSTPLAEVLPVEFLPAKFNVDPDARPQTFQPLLTTAGERSDMLALADTPEDNQKTWKGLPGWYWHYPITKLRPGAVSLVVHPVAKIGEQPMPLVATHYYGKGQVLFLASEETWRWRANAQEKFFPRFWGQVIYQLGLPHLLGSSKKAQVALEHSEAILGTPGYVYARLFDADFRPLKDERIPGTLEFLDAKPGHERSRSVMLEAVPGQPGEYRALLAHDAPGKYELKLNSSEPATLPYRVSLPPRHEQESIGMAEDVLREAARISGGKFYREEDLHRLSTEIETRKTVFTQRQEVLLWGRLAMILFVCVITAEWLVRKMTNLS